jgi:hypothetical protein
LPDRGIDRFRIRRRIGPGKGRAAGQRRQPEARAQARQEIADGAAIEGLFRDQDRQVGIRDGYQPQFGGEDQGGIGWGDACDHGDSFLEEGVCQNILPKWAGVNG